MAFASLSHRIYSILELDTMRGRLSRAINVSLMVLIALNVLAVIIETVPNLTVSNRSWLRWFEAFSVVVFTLEYLARLLTCVDDRRFQSPLTGRLRYMLTFMATIDLFAILPFYLPLIFPLDLRFLRILRLARVFRVFKLGRYSSSARLLGNVLREKKEELVLSFALVILLLLVSSSLMYFVEHAVQPEAFSSIPATMWWGVCTLTTVGYGDVFPLTPLGKFLAALISIMGIGVFALPAGILAAGCSQAIKAKKERMCPHCGKPLS